MYQQPISLTSTGEYESLYNASSKHFIILDAYAEWCRPCQRFGPVFAKFCEEYSENIEFVTLDVDNEECQNIVEECKITGLPTVLFFETAGKSPFKVCDKIVGTIDTAKFKEKLDHLVQKSRELAVKSLEQTPLPDANDMDF